MSGEPEILLECGCGCKFIVVLVQMNYFCPKCRKIISALEAKTPSPGLGLREP